MRSRPTPPKKLTFVHQVSIAAYRRQLIKLRIMIRGALIGLIHQHDLQAYSSPHNDARSVTLVGTDVPSVENAASMFHEAWGYALEVVTGFVFLAFEVGWVWPLPIVLIYRESLPSGTGG